MEHPDLWGILAKDNCGAFDSLWSLKEELSWEPGKRDVWLVRICSSHPCHDGAVTWMGHPDLWGILAKGEICQVRVDAKGRLSG